MYIVTNVLPTQQKLAYSNRLLPTIYIYIYIYIYISINTLILTLTLTDIGTNVLPTQQKLAYSNRLLPTYKYIHIPIYLHVYLHT
jgi:hypothetical protein